MPPKRVATQLDGGADTVDTIANKYKKVSQREHVLLRPGMYVGSTTAENVEYWVHDQDQGHMVKKNISYIPALFKIVDEVVVNAIDHSIRQKELKANQSSGSCEDVIHLVKNIKIKVDKESGVIECLNDGNGIECQKHPEHDIYVAEMIFGHLLTSTNYDDDVERTIGGLYGMGVKLSNIFSEFFEVETIDHSKKLMYFQRWEKNMTVIKPPKITKCSKKPYTLIRFKPDYTRFGLANLTDDMFKVFERRAFDACAVTDTDVSIFFNDRKLEYKSFERYADIFLGPKDARERIYEKINERWEVIASYSDFNGFEQISFVNGVNTLRGGKHVECILNQVVKKMTEIINKKKKDAIVKPTSIKDNLILFVKSTIVNPSFDSQSKETLTTPMSKFGSKAELSDKFIEKLAKTELINKIMNMCNTTLEKEAKKTDGRKTSTIRGIENLDDANWAGTARSSECTLILTEGLSAKTMAIAGLSVVGRDRYGVFPLRGKLLNVKDVAPKRILDNEEISNLKKIIGLETGKVYKSVNELRYGRIMILTDADTDGAHIRQLIVNLFHTLWPSLITNDGFIIVMLTPIIRAMHRNGNVHLFYNFNDFLNWKETCLDHQDKSWTFKYLKGLGSSKEKEAKEYFRTMRTLLYTWNGQSSDNALDLAFNKKRADDRKAWLENYDKNVALDYSATNVTYEDAINKELIHFSNYDLSRSIPSAIDGLKTSQRKVLFSCFKRNLHSEVKVAQLAGYVSEVSGYHHGEQSLNMTIVGMAQDFVGSNNINLLRPNGQFGSRVHLGNDASSPRYIYTHLFDITKHLFKNDDMPLLSYMEDDDKNPIEPEYYCPVIPLVLVNGALGIGTGYSTCVPSYNPLDIIHIIRQKLKGVDEHFDILPWFRGFKGQIVKVSDGKYMSIGCAHVDGPTRVRITELPIGYSTIDFKNDLEKFADSCSDVKNVESHYKPRDVDFIITFINEAALQRHMELDENGFPKLYTILKLSNTRNLSNTNMYLFNENQQIRKYLSPHDIINNHYNVRLSFYDKRRDYMSKALQDELNILEAKLRFVKGVVDEEFSIYKKSKDEIFELLETLNFPHVGNNYDYLLRMPIFSLTQERVDQLESEILETKASLSEIQNTTSIQWWMKELDEFESAYHNYMEDWTREINELVDEAPKQKHVVRKVIRQTKSKQV